MPTERLFETKWDEAIYDAQVMLQDVETRWKQADKERKRLMAAIRIFKQLLRDGAKWPGEEVTDGPR